MTVGLDSSLDDKRGSIQGPRNIRIYHPIVYKKAGAAGDAKEGEMHWNQWYSLKSYVRSSLWIVPFIALLLYFVAIRAATAIDAWIAWVPEWP